MSDALQQNDPATGTTPATGAARAVGVSDSAAARLAVLIAREDKPGLMLRVYVSGGGCSGFQYGFTFDDTINADDHRFEKAGVSVLVDDASLDLLAGSEIDWVEDLGSAAFKVSNPNATASCGCGSSFSI
jgi:iron-sulfur cluster insertion protein